MERGTHQISHEKKTHVSSPQTQDHQYDREKNMTHVSMLTSELTRKLKTTLVTGAAVPVTGVSSEAGRCEKIANQWYNNVLTKHTRLQ